MRACFLRENICALGYGVAMVQNQPAPEKPQAETCPLPDPSPNPEKIPPNRMFAALGRLPHYS